MMQCKTQGCRKQFSVKIGTIFEDSPLGLDKWFVAVWSITNCKNGISSCELARAIDITQKSAWHMLHRVRHAMNTGSFMKFAGSVEADETYVGGLAKNMHADKRAKKITGGGPKDKAVVMGLLERHTRNRHSTVRAMVLDKQPTRADMREIIHKNVEPDSRLFTDAHAAYVGLGSDYMHRFIDHAEKYVDGIVHTNGIENFWSLLKRALKGTYVSVDVAHLGRYADEQAFRFNKRKLDDGGRFAVVMPGIIGKRLMYKTLIGADTVENLKKDGRDGSGLAS
jgi:transposase-like protein